MFDVAKGYRRTELAVWLCCWSSEPVASWLAGSSGSKRFSPLLLGLTPDLGTTTKEISNIRSRDILLLSTQHKLLKISTCWCFLSFCLVCKTEQTVCRKVSWSPWLPLWVPQVAADPGSPACSDFVCDFGGNGRNLKCCFSEGTGPDRERGLRSTPL